MNEPTIWEGCYNGSWNGILTPDSFAHPAKVAPGLSYRIYQYLLERGYIMPGDSVLDPFAGIGGFAYHALLHGLHFTGVELELRFVELAQRNIAKWQRDLAMLNGRLGTAQIVQGDSRRLVEVVGAGQTAVIASPPFEGVEPVQDKSFWLNDGRKAPPQGQDGYGSTPGQLGAMRSGDYAAAVSSPPFSGDKNLMAVNDQGVRSDMVARHGAVESDTQQSPGNLAALRADSAGFNAAVSSPPYADSVNGGAGPGARHDPIFHKGENAYKASSDNAYGATPGNLGSMAGEGWDAAVSSPPYSGEALGHDAGCVRLDDAEDARRAAEGAARRPGYGDAPGNIGNDQGETFWSAARLICEQTYAALRPGGYAVFVTKDFVRRGQRVPFSDQWEQLCAAVGFTPLERIHAMLVDDHGVQLDIFGGATPRRRERKSFFRRLAEKNGSPRIDHEDVIVMRKPPQGTP